MANSLKYRYPPAPNSGDQTFSPDLVGFQLVNGGGLTQANFEFTTSVVEKVNRTFTVGAFSEPINLDDLDIGDPNSEYKALRKLKDIAKKNKVYSSFIGMGYYGTYTPYVYLEIF